MGHEERLTPSQRRNAVKPSESTKARARELRSNMSKPEAILWTRLSRRQLGFAFRRQRPIGPYIVDFYCHELLLIVEVDGWCHKDRGAHDRQRDCWLRSNDFTIVRLPARDVLADLDREVARISQVCKHLEAKSVPPTPPGSPDSAA
ncbi:MAG: DUF559 domain-containing protein [Phycisphaerales bacterium]|nr:DUF559 domain-containing protein [Phycisphaerales bacterium]